MLHASTFNAQVASLPSGLKGGGWYWLYRRRASLGMLSKRVWPVAVAGRRCTSHGTATYDRRTTPQDQLKSDSCSLGLLDRTPATDFEEASGAAQAAPEIPVQCVVSERARARNAQCPWYWSTTTALNLGPPSVGRNARRFRMLNWWKSRGGAGAVRQSAEVRGPAALRQWLLCPLLTQARLRQPSACPWNPVLTQRDRAPFIFAGIRRAT